MRTRWLRLRNMWRFRGNWFRFRRMLTGLPRESRSRHLARPRAWTRRHDYDRRAARVRIASSCDRVVVQTAFARAAERSGVNRFACTIGGILKSGTAVRSIEFTTARRWVPMLSCGTNRSCHDFAAMSVLIPVVARRTLSNLWNTALPVGVKVLTGAALLSPHDCAGARDMIPASAHRARVPVAHAEVVVVVVAEVQRAAGNSNVHAFIQK